MSGVETFTGVTGYSNIRIINGVDNVEKPLEDKISKNGTYVDEILDDDCYFGDIVEYNASTVNEIKITDIIQEVSFEEMIKLTKKNGKRLSPINRVLS